MDHHEIPTGITYPSLPKQWELIDEGYHESVADSQFVETSNDGRFGIEFAPPEAGLYQMRLVDSTGHFVAKAKDLNDLYYSATGNSAQTPIQYIAADESTILPPLPRGADLLIAPETVQIGNNFRALLVTPDPETSTLISVVQEQDSQSSILPAGQKLRWINLDSSATEVGASWLISSKLDESYPQKHQFEILPMNDDLNIAIAAPSEIRPGEQKQIEFAVTDANGSPAQAQITFVAADESVLNLTDKGDDFLDSVFNHTSVYSDARIIKSPQPTSQTFYPANDYRKGAVTHTYAGSVPRQYQEDVIVLSPFSVEEYDGSGYMASSTLAGTRVRTQFRDIGSAISIDSPEIMRNEGGISGNFSDSGSSPIRIRRHFASTAAWEPVILTNEDGVTFPDNLTS